ncbi:hypothetical protein GH733_014606 [Mirounga leonina]|nr:hypothetical protein GH733_014606 [Mirounga leonina]
MRESLGTSSQNCPTAFGVGEGSRMDKGLQKWPKPGSAAGAPSQALPVPQLQHPICLSPCPPTSSLLSALIFSQFSGLGLQLWPLGSEVPARDRAVIFTPVSTSAPLPTAPGSSRDLPGPRIPDSAAAAAAATA